MTSSIPAFKAALLARLDAATATDVQVTWGSPHPAPMQPKFAWIGGTRERTIQYVAGMAAANERYLVDITITVAGSAQQPQSDLLTAAYVIDDAMRTSLLTWKGTDYDGVVDYVVPGPGEDAEALTETGAEREASVKLTVEVMARI